jgi:hypothetical protein
MTSMDVSALNRLSIKRAIDPLVDLDLSDAPSPDSFWMTEHLLSLYGTPEYERLTLEQRRILSHHEFSLLCSISCFGEKEVIANIARLMLKKRFEDVRSYLYFFIKEENNHIYMFTEFCSRYGTMYRSMYPYIVDFQWEDPLIADLLTFVHVLVFEELGSAYNAVMAKDESLPPLVRRINQIHTIDEGRHIAFGRQLVADLAADIFSRASKETAERLRQHIQRYVETRHVEYHNVDIYRAVGIPDPMEVRQRLIKSRDIGFFERAAGTEIKVLDFLRDVDLLAKQPIAA